MLDIKHIFKEKLGAKVKSTKDITSGLDHKVQLVETDKKKYIFKVPIEDNHNGFKQNFAYGTFSKIGVPVPKVLFFSKDYIIEEVVKGKSLDKVKLSESEYREIYIQLGRLLKKIHQITFSGFGEIIPPGKTKLKSLKDTDLDFIPKRIKNLEKLKYFSKDELKKIRDFFEKNQPNYKDNFLLHGDISDDHIFIKGGKICGIIDWNDIMSGQPEFDLAQMYIQYHDNYRFEALLKGYGKANMKDVRYYSAFRLTSKIKRNLENSGSKKKLERLTSLFREIVGF